MELNLKKPPRDLETNRPTDLFISTFLFSAERMRRRGFSQNCGAPLGTPRMSTMGPRWSALQLLVGAAGKMAGSELRSCSSSALAAQRCGLGEVEELLALAPTLSRLTQLRLHNKLSDMIQEVWDMRCNAWVVDMGCEVEDVWCEVWDKR